MTTAANDAPGRQWVPFVLLDYGQMVCAVSHAQVSSISPGGDAAVKIDSVLGMTSAQGYSRVLGTEVQGVGVGCQTSASLAIVEVPTASLYFLPRVVRDAGCAPWVHGVIALADTSAGVRLAIWLDLETMAAGAGNGTRT